MAESEWIPISEAERLTGLSPRTIKRMIAEGQIKSARTQGDHVRVLRSDVDRLLRREAPASVSASSVLQGKRERVEELALTAEELRANRVVQTLTEEAAELDRRRTQAQRAQELTDARAVHEARLQTARDAESKARAEREAEAQRQRAEFRRRWVSFATDRFPVWVSYEHRQALLAAVEETIAARDVADEDLMPRLLGDAISRICAPWELERLSQQKREELIERTITSGLPVGATDSEKAKAAASARSALAQVPATGSDWELRAAVSGAVEPIVKAIEKRNAEARERAEQHAKAEKAKEEARRALEARESKARTDAVLRRIRKGNLVAAGVARVQSYLTELYHDEEISRDDWLSLQLQRDLEEDARAALESELTGADDESENDARQIAEEVVDEVLL